VKRTLVMIVGAGVIAAAIAIGLGKETAHAAPAPGSLLTGAVGGDFDSQLPPGSGVGADFGVDVGLPRQAGNLLGDNDVYIALRWQDGGGQTIPTTSDTNAGCSGTVAHPTAPRGKVCIYVAGGDNAANVSGYSVRPGTGESRLGFKLKWDAAHNGDTFIDAVWAYRYP
jgi:hypothetical protein